MRLFILIFLFFFSFLSNFKCHFIFNFIFCNSIRILGLGVLIHKHFLILSLRHSRLIKTIYRRSLGYWSYSRWQASIVSDSWCVIIQITIYFLFVSLHVHNHLQVIQFLSSLQIYHSIDKGLFSHWHNFLAYVFYYIVF